MLASYRANAAIMDWALGLGRDAQLTVTALRLGLLLAWKYQIEEDGSALSRQELADELSCSKRAIDNAVKLLEDAQHIVVVRTTGRSNVNRYIPNWKGKTPSLPKSAGLSAGML